LVDEDSRKLAKAGLSAAIGQLREDGGITVSSNGKWLRGNGVSAYWLEVHDRLVSRLDTQKDYWRATLWPLRDRSPWTDIGEVALKLDNDAAYVGRQAHLASDALVLDESKLALVYCLNRGLCGKKPPMHEKTDDTFDDLSNDLLDYTIPRVLFPGKPNVNGKDISAMKDEREVADCLFDLSMGARSLDYDIVARVVGDPIDKPAQARWAPVKAVRGPRSRTPSVMADHDNEETLAVADAVVYEHMAVFFKQKATEEVYNPKGQAAFLGAVAACKIKQLNSMSVIFTSDNKRDITPCVIKTNPTAPTTHAFFTRPVYHCPSGRVLYPCDAGLAHIKVLSTPVDPAALSTIDRLPDQDYVLSDAMPDGRRQLQFRSTMSAYMRAALGSKPVPLYVAPGAGTQNPEPFPNKKYKMRDYTRGTYPKESHSCSSTMRFGVQLCERLTALDRERERMKSLKSDDSIKDTDDISRQRRDAVWNDNLREACIAGDRLYAFVRQLSGTISEAVDAVCMIDEGMLVRQQQQLRDRRSRISDRAAQEHMQLVRSVFASVVRESGLTLGISNDNGMGDVGQLKVMSNALRKQVSQLAQGGGEGGFFSNSVRLEQLMQKGTGEMTLSDLFSRLQEAGQALQEAAANALTEDVPGSGTSLDFLSAPRNALVLRYKPEALAAIRQAFDTFQREMMQAHGRLWRTISAYELVEGNDEQLCTAFATFAAHTLVHARMYSSATAMYVAAWPAAANAQQLKISLQRLVRVACNYLAHSNEPAFSIATGRANYFRQAPPPTGGSAPMMAAPRYGVQGGLWGLNMYGNR